jgi:hypothetical protein
MNDNSSWIFWVLVGMVVYQSIRFRVVMRTRSRFLRKKLAEASEKISTQISEELITSIELVGTQTAKLIDVVGLEKFDIENLLNHPQITDILITNQEGRIIQTNNVTWTNTTLSRKFPELKTDGLQATTTQHIDASSYCICPLKEGLLVIIFKMQEIELDI